MKALLPRLLALSLCLLAFAGCMGGIKLNSISVEIIEVRKGPSAGEIGMTVRYSNENVIPIAIDHTTHKVYVNGKLLGKCVSNAPVGLPPTKSIDEKLILKIEDKALLADLVAKASTQTASYKLETRIFVKSGEEDLDSRASNTGALDFRKLAE
jgi:LEA14-like dessication related protein